MDIGVRTHVTSPNINIAVTEINTASHDGTKRSKNTGNASIAIELASSKVTSKI